MSSDLSSSASHTGLGTDTPSGRKRLALCWLLLIVWALSFAASQVWTHPAIGLLSGGLLPVLLLVHGSLLYGWRGIAAFVALGLVIGFGFEITSTRFGFPFGAYVHNSEQFKIAGIPIIALSGYTLVGWFAWTVSKVLVLDRPDREHNLGRFTVPIVAAFILAGFDLPFDPIGATAQQGWTFAHPSGQFGVPLTNFLGWILTGWVLFQAFALLERRFTKSQVVRTRAYWAIPCLFWLGMALQFPLQWLDAPGGTVTLVDRTYVIADVYEGAVITSLFTMVAIGLLALFRLAHSKSV